MMGELKRIGLAAAALVIALVVCLALTVGRDAYLRFVEEANTPEPVLTEGLEGLPVGVTLDTEPNYVQDGYAVFDDRAVKLFETDEATLATCTTAQRALFDSVPEGVSKYALLAPTRALFEPSLQEMTNDQAAAISHAYSAMPSDVTCIDAVSVLQEHADEYLYYRTDGDWTFLGAYWASRAALDACGLEGIDISEYRRDTRSELHGSYASRFDIDGVDDLAAYYIHPNLPNSAEISTRLGSGTGSDLYSAPALAVSRGGDSIALGSYISYAAIEGAADNGRTILIAGDSDAKSFATWLIASFEQIVYVDIDWNTLEAAEFHELFATYGVTDFLLFQSIDALSLGNGNSSLYDLAGEE